MKHFLLAGFLCFALSLGVVIADDTAVVAVDSEPAFVPGEFSVERYEHIWKRSPFIVETKVIEESAGLAQRFALTGVAVVNDEPIAFLLDRSSLSRIIVSKANPGSHGIELLSVDHQPVVRNSTATIKLGAEQASLKFDSDFLASISGSAPQQNGANPPVIQPPPGNQASVNQVNGQPQPNAPARVIRRTLIRTRE